MQPLYNDYFRLLILSAHLNKNTPLITTNGLPVADTKERVHRQAGGVFSEDKTGKNSCAGRTSFRFIFTCNILPYSILRFGRASKCGLGLLRVCFVVAAALSKKAGYTFFGHFLLSFTLCCNFMIT
jgi:hypothetical protein